MTTLRFYEGEGGQTIEVNADQPLPVYTDAAYASVSTRLAIVPGIAQVPGIGTAAAYANLDQMGTLGRFTNMPAAGVIRDFRWLDYDNEGIDKIVYLFSDKVTIAADNAAFTLADANLRQLIGIFQFSTWRAVSNAQVGLTANTPAYYNMGAAGYIYFAVQTLGTDNIAAGAIPELSILIEAAQ